MQSRDTRTFVAGEDLSTAQFKFVTLEADGQVDLADSAGENCVGVLRVEGAATRAVTVVMTGSVMVEAGGTVTAGGAVATDATGRAVDATTSDIIMGYAREAGVVNQVIEIELIQGGNASA
tara:strand:+ start:623 stop:985 length:363 start_codon:yes stop_codon:yes gene_type:complete